MRGNSPKFQLPIICQKFTYDTLISQLYGWLPLELTQSYLNVSYTGEYKRFYIDYQKVWYFNVVRGPTWRCLSKRCNTFLNWLELLPNLDFQKNALSITTGPDCSIQIGIPFLVKAILNCRKLVSCYMYGVSTFLGNNYPVKAKKALQVYFF